HLEELWALTGPTPPLKCAMGDPPADCQFKLVQMSFLQFRFLSLGPVWLRHDEGVGGKNCQGNTGGCHNTGALPRLVLNSAVPRKRRLSYEYEGMLTGCGAYFERVCRRVLSLRQKPRFPARDSISIPCSFMQRFQNEA